MDLNRATILGRLTQDPEVKTTPSGQSVANITLATNRMWTDKSGNKQEKSEFHNCVLWGRIAEVAGQYLTKGRKVYVEGRIETRDWVGKDGVKRYRTEIIVENMIMVDGNRSGGSSAGGYGSNTNQSADIETRSRSVASEEEAPEIKVEDIPF